MAKNSFVLYYNYEEQLEDLTDEQVGKLLRALFQYEIHDTLPEFADKELKVAFKFIKPILDADKEKYNSVCKKNRNNIQKRWTEKNTTIKNDIPNNTVVSFGKNENTKNTDKGYMKDDIDNKKKRVKEKGEASSHPPIEKKSKKEQYIEFVQASSLSTKVQEEILEWLEYKKWKYTEMGIKSLVTTVAKNVEKYGENAVCAVIVESMGNMWQGICWDKLGRKEQREEEKEEAEYIEDGEYLIFKKTGARIHKETYASWSRKDN